MPVLELTQLRRMALGACASTVGIALLLMALSAAGAQASPCAAQNNYKEGAVNGAWTTAANWSEGKEPTSTETACIPAGDGTITIADAVKAEVKTLLAQSALTIAAGGTLTIAETLKGVGTASTFSGLDIEAGGHLSTAAGWLFLSGSVILEGEISTTKPTEALVRLVGGTLAGSGTIAVQFNNEAGTLEPGGAGVVGVLHFTMLSSQSPAGTLVLDLASGTSFDRLSDTTSNFFAEGTLEDNVLGSYTPPVGTKWEFMAGGPGTSMEFETFNPINFTARSVPFGAEVELVSALPPTTKGKEEEKEEPKAVAEEPSTGGGGSTTTGSTTTTTTNGGSANTPTIGPSTMPGAIPTPVATTPQAVEELLLGCSRSPLVLNDAYIHGGRVLLIGSAAKSLVGKKVMILFNEKKQVASATVGANGQFATTAPLPPAKVREALTTRYTAEVGKVRSLHLKLTRRLLLEPPKASGTTVTLSGQVTLPLTKPAAPVVVEQQLECGKTTVVKTFTPPASGRFNITLTVPANARAGIYRLISKVAANAHAVKHGFTTFSLPLPVTLG